jgi:hypothetical protein
MKGLRKRLLSVILVIAIMSVSFILPEKEADAATTYITVESFSNSLAKEIGLKSVSGTAESGYVNALIKAGIIKEGDFTKYTGYLTRTDLGVLLNRADEYLYGDTLNADLVSLALEKRISDIKKITASKRTDVVKAYLKGFIKGYDNGDYSTNREYRGSNKASKEGALNCIKMLKNKSLRAKISPDGQLIRTTNLPKNADMFPYILASYPNKYYEWKLTYEVSTITLGDGKKKELVNLVDYASPKDIDYLKLDACPDFSAIKEEYLNSWVEKARKHTELVFSADYRTIGDIWGNALLDTSYAKGTNYEYFPQRLIDEYITNMKKNKTIVEYYKIAVDGSSLYYFDDNFYLRVYVKYRIVSSKVPSKISDEDFVVNRLYNHILFSNTFVYIPGYVIGKWTEGYYDILIGVDSSFKNVGVVGIEIYKGEAW